MISNAFYIIPNKLDTIGTSNEWRKKERNDWMNEWMDTLCMDQNQNLIHTYIHTQIVTQLEKQNPNLLPSPFHLCPSVSPIPNVKDSKFQIRLLNFFLFHFSSQTLLTLLYPTLSSPLTRDRIRLANTWHGIDGHFRFSRTSNIMSGKSEEEFGLDWICMKSLLYLSIFIYPLF